jgi:hypothetical protein
MPFKSTSLGGFHLEKCIILSARQYDFNDKDTGRNVRGVTLNYLTADVEQEPERRGMPVLTISAAFELWPSLSVVPGVYELDLKQRPGKNGRPTLTCTGVTFIAPVDLARGLVSSPPASFASSNT